MSTLKEKVFKKYVYAKLCINRTMSHVAVPMTILDKALLVVLLLKVNNAGNTAWILVAAACIALLLGMLVVGHWDLKHGLAEAEQSLNNRFNPELRSIYENAKK